jgi:hypothetical protein
MPMKVTQEADSWAEIDRWAHGVGWIAHPGEAMQRASHALEVDGEVWIVDPVDVAGLDELLAEFGTVAGVVLLLDRHKRDAASIANRHDVAVHVPAWMDGVEPNIAAPVERVRTEVGQTGYGVHPVIDNRFWQEAALYGEDTGHLLVSEALGSAPYYRRKNHDVGVHPALRLFPPKRLRQFTPRRVDFGHGRGTDADPEGKIRRAIDRSRRSAPGLYAHILKQQLLG